MDLFSQSQDQSQKPLAERLRPQTFQDLVGQSKIFSKNQSLLQRINEGNLQSLILWGPPGCGKTSFANAIIQEVKAEVYQENAIDLGAKRIRELGELAKRNLFEQQKKTVVFVDEIHRLNRGQQDVLLPFVEKGYFYLIGATTENPSYQLNAALMSRCRLIVLESLNQDDLMSLTLKAFSQEKLELEKVLSVDAKEELIHSSHGDARKLLNSLEEIFYCYKSPGEYNFPLSADDLEELFRSSGLRFDKKGDEHYDTISVFIKSIRGSDPDAAIYYLARMLEGGEDPLFIARRLVVLASEDVGNGDPNALSVAVNGMHAVELVGLPEARINLAQVVTYLASAPKSNRSYMALNKAMAEVKKSGPLAVPKTFRSSKTKLMKQLGYGEGYKYSHDGETGWLPQDYFPEELKNRNFYEPSERGFEKRIREYLAWMKGEKKS
ncbi:MAG: replication-associated recombination protein A [Bdellovibrionales bacterium]|nr:replication-associated recombination protein A [Bdellovibrionales bacterium]NQZ17651.1 replication-associated recombination protein A [Bdellovibrionales bacterium]